MVRGQVKQARKFSFVRVYEAGHKVLFYQPELSLTLFARTINRKDIATGLLDANSSYRSTGPARSLYREGNSTVQFQVLGPNATYNTTTGAPNESSTGVSHKSLGFCYWMGIRKGFKGVGNICDCDNATC